MLRPGDNAICIDSYFYNTTINKTYIILNAFYHNNTEHVSFIDDSGNLMKGVYATRFKLDIKNQRKRKLNKICSNKETK